MKIQPGQCRCGEIIYLVEDAGLRWTADMTPLDAQTALTALLAGRELYGVHRREGTPHKLSYVSTEVLAELNLPDPLDRPLVVASHGCPPGAARALGTPVPGSSVQPTPPGPSVGRTAPSLGPQTGPSSVRSAVSQDSKPSNGPRCDACSQPCADGTYASIEVGDLLIWAEHINTCP